MFKKLLLALLAIAVLGGVIIAAFGERILVAAIKRQVHYNLSGEAFAKFGDGLNVVLCGAGSPVPDPKRAGPCVAVIAGGRIMLVDTGAGAIRNLAPEGIPVGKVSGVFLTHFHSDHIDGLGELMLQRWGNGSHTAPLPVHGPTGVEQVVQGFNMAYAQDDQYRVAHHGPVIMPPAGAGGLAVPFAPPADGAATVVLDEGGLKVIAFSVDHAPIKPAVGYRFDYKGRSVLISGDTKKSATVEKYAKDVDLLVHEALNEDMVQLITDGADEAGAKNIAQITRDIHGYHTTPVQAAEIASAAGARHLLYYHIVPALPLRPLERMFVKGVSAVYSGGVTVGHDGTWVSLPAGSKAITVKQIRLGR